MDRASGDKAEIRTSHRNVMHFGLRQEIGQKLSLLFTNPRPGRNAVQSVELLDQEFPFASMCRIPQYRLQSPVTFPAEVDRDPLTSSTMMDYQFNYV